MKAYVITREDGKREAAKTLANVAAVLGVDKVTKKDIEAGKVDLVTIEDIHLGQARKAEFNKVGVIDLANDKPQTEEKAPASESMKEDLNEQIAIEEPKEEPVEEVAEEEELRTDMTGIILLSTDKAVEYFTKGITIYLIDQNEEGLYFITGKAKSEKDIVKTKHILGVDIRAIGELPDPGITQEVLDNYGYTYTGMYGIDSVDAGEFFDLGLPVYILYEDNTEALLMNYKDIEPHSGYFGVQKSDWDLEPKKEIPAKPKKKAKAKPKAKPKAETKKDSVSEDMLKKLADHNKKLIDKNPELKKKKGKKSIIELETDEEGNVVYPEKGFFTTEAEIKAYYKQLTNEELDEWIEVEGLEYTPSDNPGINRMRKALAIKNLHFPVKTSKKESKYKDYTTEELVQLAFDNDVEVKEAKGNNLAILRMYTIMALREAGIIE